ncbi:leucine-rich repeat-containing protein 51 isoform X3 [Tamandua tetradactyla]|uniref:leucine-rich repeat-containing protein 51 isoform X3 n=1 Tax=Tamandua tetradactyla TaxID=48850 RepID=UPI0040546ADE
MNRRDYIKTSVQEPPLDYSFRSIHVVQDLTSEEPRTGLRPLRHSKSGKSLTQSLWLNNNVLNDLRDFSQVVSQLLEYPENLAWIDLSFNDLTSIDPNLKSSKLDRSSMKGQLRPRERQGLAQSPGKSVAEPRPKPIFPASQITALFQCDAPETLKRS